MLTVAEIDLLSEALSHMRERRLSGAEMAMLPSIREKFDRMRTEAGFLEKEPPSPLEVEHLRETGEVYIKNPPGDEECLKEAEATTEKINAKVEELRKTVEEARKA